MSSSPSSSTSVPTLASSSPVRNLPDILSLTKESDIQSAAKDSSTTQGPGGVRNTERHYISSNCM